MKKVMLAAIAVFGLATTANAQIDMRFGPKAGLNLANVSDVDGSSMRTAYYVGAVAEFKLTHRFSIQPELMYSAQGAEGKVLGVKTRFQNDYVTIPVLAKYYLVDGLNVEFGPQIGFLVNSKISGDTNIAGIDISSGDYDSKDFYESTDFSLALGASYELPMGFFVNTRYNLGLTKVNSKDGNLLFGNKELKNNVIQIGAGYKF